MVPKLITGSSFKGAAAYLLHDTDGSSQERVAWTDVRNIASRNPETAWRVMAATAKDADRLKEQAGVKNTGRKSAKSVLHLVLSWHPEEKDRLDRDQMLGAAEGALAALGASDRQALIIAHNDAKHPHVHVLVNRVSPKDGRMLSSSKQKLKLSEWAQHYEEERGKIYCEERVLNNEARKRGEYTRAAKDVPWPIVAAEKVARTAANDNPSRAEQIRQDLRSRMQTLGQRMRAMRNRHAGEWRAFEAAHVERRSAIVDAFRRDRAKAKAEIIATYRPLWRALHAAERDEVKAFEANERTTLGKARSILRMVSSWRSIADGDRLKAASRIWSGLFSAEERRALLKGEHKARRTALQHRQRQDIRRTVVPLIATYRADLRNNAEAYQAERSSLVFAHRGDVAKLRAEWNRLRQDRAKAYEQLQASAEMKRDFGSQVEPRSLYDRLKDIARTRQDLAPEQDNERDRERE